MLHRKITIFGAGISGLVAAINLSKSGFEVEVREKREKVGGSPKWNPSIHLQTFDLSKTFTYISIALSSSFHPIKKAYYLILRHRHLYLHS